MSANITAITSDPIIKSIGFSVAAGVLVDAFVVRLTLVPAVMAISEGGQLHPHELDVRTLVGLVEQSGVLVPPARIRQA